MWEKRFNEQTATAADCYEEKQNLQSEIDTVTQWLDMLEIPDTEETGIEIGWMRRVAIALGIQPHKIESELPNVSDRVLIFHSGKVEIACLTEDGEWNPDSNEFIKKSKVERWERLTKYLTVEDEK